jgi:NAD(P)-dependent dehydrogenase (short-subunit alcohol dehydrogenase family)
MDATAKVLAVLKKMSSADRKGKYFQEVRRAAVDLSGEMEKEYFNGRTKTDHSLLMLKNARRAQLADKEKKLKLLDRKRINAATMRADRIQALQALCEGNGAPMLTDETSGGGGGGGDAEKIDEFIGVSAETRAAILDVPADTASEATNAAAKRRGPKAPKPPRDRSRRKQKKYKDVDDDVVDDGDDDDAKNDDGVATQRRGSVDIVDLDVEAAHAKMCDTVDIEAGTANDGVDEALLSSPRSCYTCKRRFLQLHHWYDQLCPACAALNWEKRMQMAPMSGKVVVLTGSRVKIGFECGLRLLRCGAVVVATSRFPHDTTARYLAQADSGDWKSNLHVYGLDLRDLQAVVRFCDIVADRYDRLDAIVNNAAQTVRRPPAYYRHLMPSELLETTELSEDAQTMLRGDPHREHRTAPGGSRFIQDLDPRNRYRILANAATADGSVEIEDADDDDVVAAAADASSDSVAAAGVAVAAAAAAAAGAPSSTGAAATAVAASGVGGSGASNTSAALSQVALMKGDDVDDEKLFPVGAFDVTGQQLDKRPVNSWVLLLDQVEPTELIEVFAINALAPFIINARLKRLMIQGQEATSKKTSVSDAHGTTDTSAQSPSPPPSSSSSSDSSSASPVNKYIINVSAMEGKFYRNKAPTHPHTNMAKAALNMLTRTSAQDYARHRIYMNSVDTGWINEENPYDKAQEIAKLDFQTPIDEIDAASRILDPIIVGINENITPYGGFYKDYHTTEW